MTGPPDASVVIVSFNGRAHLERCLEAVLAQRGPSFEVIVVDNGSSDGSVAYLGERFPSVRVVALPVNAGFAAGNNRGAAVAVSSRLVFLNNDTEVESGWLAALVAAADTNAHTGLVTSKIVFLHDPSILDSAGDAWTRAGGAFKRGHGRPAAEYAARQPVFGACGASFLIAKRLFDECGGFDEEFFLSHEDVDLSYRVRLRGYGCLYEPASVVRHVGSASLGRSSARAIFHGQRNLEWVYLKNTPGWVLPATFPLHLVYVAAAGAYFTAIGQLPSFLRAKWAALAGAPRMWRKRRAIQAARRATPGEVWRTLDRGWLGVKLGEKRFDLGLAGSSSR
jgi:GT2 family glycosyltransferase